MRHRTALQVASGIYLILVLLSVTLNWLIDPFNIYGNADLLFADREREHIGKRIRLHQLLSIADHRPQALYLGTSRTGLGLRTDHPLLGGMEVFNLALPGASPLELRRNLEHVNHLSGRIELLLVGLDLFVFNHHFEAATDYDDRLYLADIDGRKRAGWWFERYRLLFSLDSIEAALDIFGSEKEADFYISEHGGWHHRSPPADYHQAFEESEIAYLKTTFLQQGRRRFRLNQSPASTSSLDQIATLIERAREAGIDRVVLFVSPSHIRHWLLMMKSGAWPDFEQWKRQLVTMVDNASSEGKMEISFWDFSGANRYTTEPVPEKSGEVMKWYRESSHYLPALGDLIINQVVGGEDINDFGVRLTGQNIENHLTALRTAMSDHATSYPAVSDEIERIITEYIGKNSTSNGAAAP